MSPAGYPYSLDDHFGRVVAAHCVYGNNQPLRQNWFLPDENNMQAKHCPLLRQPHGRHIGHSWRKHGVAASTRRNSGTHYEHLA
jgi:hypothetical protein